MSRMPILPVDAMVADCNESDAWIIRAAFTSRGVPAGGKLRTGKPFKRVTSQREGCANYVWRMLCFDLCDWAPHYCMPICADFEISFGYEAEYGRPDRSDKEAATLRRGNVRAMMRVLDLLVKKAESSLPVGSMKGIMRWGKAYGMV